MRKAPGISILACLLLSLLAVAAVHAQNEDPPVRAGRLNRLKGNVSVQPAGVDQWNQAVPNYPIATGDRVYADQNARAELQLGSTVVRLWQTTDLAITNLADNITQLGLSQGTVRVRTYGLDPGAQVELDTPNGALTVTHPGDFRVDSYAENGGTVVTVNSGELNVSGPNLSQNIKAGQSLRLAGTNPVELATLPMPGLDAFDQWSMERDRHILNAQSARYVSRDTVGYDDLDDYGAWDQTPDYGPVWYPRSVAADWVPYRAGHWVWVSPWGWTWVDDQPWGYAPFHFGRWVYVGSRWGWMPGPVAVRPVWAPAFVAFAGGAGFSVGASMGGGGRLSAWFPLGPGEPFYPWYRSSPRYVRQVNVTNVNIVNIHNTTVVNNYNTFINSARDVRTMNNVRIQYANRERAFTAVPQRDFAGARPVQQSLVRVNQQQIQRAQILAGPRVEPTLASKVPHPVRVSAVSTTRPTLLNRGGREMQAQPRPVPNQAQPEKIAARMPQQQPGNSSRPLAPAAGYNRPNVPGEGSGGARPLITRSGSQQVINRGGSRAGQPGLQPQRQAPQENSERLLEPPPMDRPNPGRPASRPRDQEPQPRQVYRPPQRQLEPPVQPSNQNRTARPGSRPWNARSGNP